MNVSSCSNAVPVIMLPRNTLMNWKIKYLVADLLSREDRLINPSNLDIVINIVGRKIRNIFKAIPGRKPCIKDFMNFLKKKNET